MNIAALVWVGLLAAFLIIEASCPIHLVSIWFAAGSLSAMVAALLHAQLWLQITLFFVVSCALLACMWPFIRKFLNPKLTKTNIDSVVDAVGLVTESIDNMRACGQVKLGAMYWSARSTDDTPIEKGMQIKVDRIEGVKVFVSRLPAPVETK